MKQLEANKSYLVRVTEVQKYEYLIEAISPEDAECRASELIDEKLARQKYDDFEFVDSTVNMDDAEEVPNETANH